MITTETFFWFYSTLAQVAAAIITLICVFFITYYSIIRSRQLDRRREEKLKIDELRRIMDFRWELSSLFKDSSEIFSGKLIDIDQANKRFVEAMNSKEGLIKAFKEICMSFALPFRTPLSNKNLDDYMTKLIIFSNAMICQDLIKYLKKENRQLTYAKIAEIKSKAQHYVEVINKIKDIRRAINQNKFKRHFPNQNKIRNWMIVASFFGIFMPLFVLLVLEWFSINYGIFSLFSTSFLAILIFICALYKTASLIIEDMTSKRTEVVID